MRRVTSESQVFMGIVDFESQALKEIKDLDSQADRNVDVCLFVYVRVWGHIRSCLGLTLGRAYVVPSWHAKQLCSLAWKRKFVGFGLLSLVNSKEQRVVEIVVLGVSNQGQWRP